MTSPQSSDDRDDGADLARDRYVWDVDNGRVCPHCLDRYCVEPDGKHWQCRACGWRWLSPVLT